MIRLQTLGSVFVAADSGQPLGGAASQRRTLALLAALAVAGEGGLSRDKIVGLLWPETDSERARHSLTQALYAARRALEADDLFSVNADVRLNRQRIVCDVNELEAALDAGDLERAVALYTGPFLDGFFLSGAPEFEKWSSLHRWRLEARVAEALERLAEAGETKGDYRRAVEWRKRISAIRPLDSGNTVKLMAALVESGDRAGALQHARVHELLLREQLDLEPDLAVVAFARKLREPSQPVTADPGDGGPAPRPVTLLQDSPIEPLDPATTRRNPLIIWVQKQRTDPWRLTAAVILIPAVLLAAVTLIRGPGSAPPVAQPQLRQKVVVAPFRVAGATSSLGYLRDGIVELLSTRLADDTTARAVDAGAVLGAWESAGFKTAAAVPRDSVVQLAARLGAERVVIGSVVGTPSRLILRATVFAVPSADVHGEAMVEGPADSISALIDGLAAKLLVSQAGEDEGLTSYTTASLRALRVYLAGQAAFRRDDYEGAVRHYETALELDPRFALAALRLAIAADRLNDDEKRRRGVALAWTSREELSERDLALLVALAGPDYPLASLAPAQISAWRRPVDMAPTTAESWYTLGARLFHDGAVAGIPQAESRATASLQRALVIDPDYVPAKLLLVHLTTTTSLGPADGNDLDTALVGPLDSLGPFSRWRVALARGDTAELRRVHGSLRQLDPANLRLIALASQSDGLGLADGALALEILGARARGAGRADLLLARHSMAVLQGRPRAALDATIRLGNIQPGSHAHLRLRVLDALYAEGDSAAADGAARELEVRTSGGLAAGAFTFETRLADLCVLSQWRISRGDTTGVATAVEVLRRAGTTIRQLPPVSAAPAACAELLYGSLITLMGRGDGLTRLDGLDSLVLTSQTAGDAIAYAPILMARLHERLGQPLRALQAIRKRSYMSAWPRYLATAWREEGRLAQLAGDQEGAREAYESHLAYRVSPEEDVVPQVEEVRGLLSTLSADPH